MLTASITAILCSIGFLGIGWCLRGWEDDRKRAVAARREALQRAADRREFRAIYGEPDWMGEVVELEKRRGVQRVRGLSGRRLA